MAKKSEIRKSYLLNKYVIITPGRAARPRDIKEKTQIKTRGEGCPFCPTNIDKRLVKDKINSSKKKEWEILSIKNKYPAVTKDNKKAYGAQEVIIETPDHTKDLSDLSINQIEKLLYMYKRRTESMAKDKNIDYILCFKNEGSKAGASIAHAHSQVFATNIIPEDLKEELEAMREYKAKVGSCPYCDIITKEMKSKRKIAEDEYTACFAPYASEFHYEAWIFPKRHVDNITLLKKVELRSIATTMKAVLNKMGKINLSFNYFLHNIVSSKEQHFYIKIQPRDAVWAGVELGSGLVINSIPPEEAAKFYRNN
jgi:UDPglucose--hexose-1-phosphate uridylyltransferase